MESPEINPHLYSHLIFYKERSKHIQWAKDSLFNRWYWENWTDTCRKMKIDYLLIPHTRISPKWTKDLNIRLKTIKIIEEIIVTIILNIALRKILLDIFPQARETKEK